MSINNAKSVPVNGFDEPCVAVRHGKQLSNEQVNHCIGAVHAQLYEVLEDYRMLMKQWSVGNVGITRDLTECSCHLHALTLTLQALTED